jgi:hypothetical protein
LRLDRQFKAALYARAGIPNTDLNLAEATVEVNREPIRGRNVSGEDGRSPGETLVAATVPGVAIDVALFR